MVSDTKGKVRSLGWNTPSIDAFAALVSVIIGRCQLVERLGCDLTEQQQPGVVTKVSEAVIGRLINLSASKERRACAV